MKEERNKRRRAASLCLTKREKEQDKHNQEQRQGNPTILVQSSTYAGQLGPSTEPLPCQLANDNRPIVMIKNVLPWANARRNHCKSNPLRNSDLRPGEKKNQKRVLQSFSSPLLLLLLVLKVVSMGSRRKAKEESPPEPAPASGLPGTCRRRPEPPKDHPDYRTRDPGILFGLARGGIGCACALASYRDYGSGADAVIHYRFSFLN